METKLQKREHGKSPRWQPKRHDSVARKPSKEHLENTKTNKNHMGPVITASRLLLGQRALERSPATMVWSTSERISETDPKSFSPTSAAEVSPELSPPNPWFRGPRNMICRSRLLKHLPFAGGDFQ